MANLFFRNASGLTRGELTPGPMWTQCLCEASVVPRNYLSNPCPGQSPRQRVIPRSQATKNPRRLFYNYVRLLRCARNDSTEPPSEPKPESYVSTASAKSADLRQQSSAKSFHRHAFNASQVFQPIPAGPVHKSESFFIDLAS